MHRWLILSTGAVDMVKIMALLTMVIDHVNTVLMQVPQLELYPLGRVAFPLFTLIWAMHIRLAYPGHLVMLLLIHSML